MPACYVCERNRAPVRRPWEQVYLDDDWRLTLAFDASLPGWLVLVPERHVEGLQDLHDGEAEGLGRLLRGASAALVEVTGCSRTYVMLFAEAEGFNHLHLHIVPRHSDLSLERQGPGVFAYLGSPEAQRVPEDERDALASRLREALIR